mgnify:CR=1 FL=1
MDSVINESLRRGFGSMTKNDYEVFIFNELLKTSDYEGKSDFEISIKLKIPQSKVKRLRYEAALRNGGFEENDMKNEFLKCVLTANKEEKKIYERYSGWRNGRKEFTAAEMRASHPDRMIKELLRHLFQQRNCSYDGRCLRNSYKMGRSWQCPKDRTRDTEEIPRHTFPRFPS